MATLKNFVFLKRSRLIKYPDECLKGLLHWIFSQYEMDCVERLWITEDVGILPDVMTPGNQFKSILVYGPLSTIDWEDERFGHLEHIGGVGLEHLTSLPYLRYIHGYCISSEVNSAMNAFAIITFRFPMLY